MKIIIWYVSHFIINILLIRNEHCKELMQMHIDSLKSNEKNTSPRDTFNFNEYVYVNRNYTFVECLEKVTIVVPILIMFPGFLTA